MKEELTPEQMLKLLHDRDKYHCGLYDFEDDSFFAFVRDIITNLFNKFKRK